MHTRHDVMHCVSIFIIKSYTKYMTDRHTVRTVICYTYRVNVKRDFNYTVS